MFLKYNMAQIQAEPIFQETEGSGQPIGIKTV